MSGRRRNVAVEDARLFGQGACIFEIGAGVVLEGETHWLTGSWRRRDLTIHEQIAESGAPQLLLEEYSGCLEVHAPGTPGARSPICCAVSSTPTRPTRCSRSTATRASS